jgi:hypothetical protein
MSFEITVDGFLLFLALFAVLGFLGGMIISRQAQNRDRIARRMRPIR